MTTDMGRITPAEGALISPTGLPKIQKDTCGASGSCLLPPPELKLILQTAYTKQAGARRDYPYSIHDNRDALRASVESFDMGRGLKKFSPDQSQQTSQLRYIVNPDQKYNVYSAYQYEYLPWQMMERSDKHRFPHNHRERSLAKNVQDFMWFGKDNLQCETLCLKGRRHAFSPNRPTSHRGSGLNK